MDAFKSRNQREGRYQREDGSFHLRRKHGISGRVKRHRAPLTITYTEPVTEHTKTLDSFMKGWIEMVNKTAMALPLPEIVFDVSAEGAVTLREHPEIKLSGNGVEHLVSLANGEAKSFTVKLTHGIPEMESAVVNENGMIDLPVSFDFSAYEKKEQNG